MTLRHFAIIHSWYNNRCSFSHALNEKPLIALHFHMLPFPTTSPNLYMFVQRLLHYSSTDVGPSVQISWTKYINFVSARLCLLSDSLVFQSPVTDLFQSLLPSCGTQPQNVTSAPLLAVFRNVWRPISSFVLSSNSCSAAQWLHHIGHYDRSIFSLT